MGQIRQNNGVYYIEFLARGLLYSQVAGSDLHEAQRLLKQVEDKIAAGEALTVSRTIELSDFFERFLTDIKTRHSVRTIGRFDRTIGHFRVFLGTDFPQVCHLDQLTPAILEAYKRSLVKSCRPKIVNLTILLIRDVLEFGIKIGFINDNPSLHVRLLPWPKVPLRKATRRYELAVQYLPKGLGIARFTQLANQRDIARTIYFSSLIPLSRKDVRI